LSNSTILPVLLFSFLGFLAMGYHPGAEDDAVYLPAVKAHLNPSLFPHDAAFFQLQMRTSFFDVWMADLVRITGLPVAWAELLVHAISIFLIMLAAWKILCLLFEETSARWGGIAMLGAMLTLPVAGTALFIADQYLHPRNPATALVLFAVERILSRKRWQAVPLLAVAFVLHPLMGALGISFNCILALVLHRPLRARIRAWRTQYEAGPMEASAPMAALIPFGWAFAPPSKFLLQAMSTRHWLRVYDWTWYEWIGDLAPLALFGLLYYVAKRQGRHRLSLFALAVCIYGIFQQSVAMVLQGPEMLESFRALEPMRFLHLVYVFMAVIGGAYLGIYALKGKAWRWAVFVALFYGGMYFAQRQLFASTEHLELPSTGSRNPWVQAFVWIRENTPKDAYFALDPHYMAAPDEDYHSFRALAERSALADAIKDTSVITKVPELGQMWYDQTQAEQGWNSFGRADFEQLKARFGVDWVLVANHQADGMTCPWHNDRLSVCRIP
jgi:hypothetical protein